MLMNHQILLLRRPMILIKIPQSYDLVLEFVSEPARKRFLVKLESYFTSSSGAINNNNSSSNNNSNNQSSGVRSIETVSVYKSAMLASAETKERRQKRLEHFFREAYALTFGLK